MGPRVKRKTINRDFDKPAKISGGRCRNETFVAQSTRPEAIPRQLQILSSATIFRWITAAHECFISVKWTPHSAMATKVIGEGDFPLT
jgi:hypothetical protein